MGSVLNQRLETFVKVAAAGSFNKAADDLFISVTAAIKQINSLEKDIGVKLFERTNRGLTMTAAGESFYRDALFLLQYYTGATERAQNAARHSENLLRIGTSVMTPGKFLVDLWPRLQAYLPDMKIQLIPFQNTPEIAREGEENFGRELDLVAAILDEDFMAERRCTGTWMADEPLRIAVPSHHHLYSKDKLTLQDLYGETLMMIRRGWNRIMDDLRDELEKHSEIRIATFDFYQAEAFNRCERENHLLLTIDPWKEVHPLMKVVPVEWDYTVQFGVMHSPAPSKIVREFLDAVRHIVQDT